MFLARRAMPFFTNRMEFEKSRIEKLKRSLYSRDEEVVPKDNRGTVHSEEYLTPKNWGESPSFDLPTEAMAKKRNSFFNKFLIFSVVFFLLAIGTATFIFLGGFNMISSNNVDVKIIGSNSSASGEELDLNITILNQNRTNLENVVLYVDYPAGVSEVGEIKNSSRTKINIGTIEKGESNSNSLKILFQGEKGAVKTITFKIEYTVTGSNATFSKEKTYDVTINSSPIILEATYPKEINSGQEVVLNIDLTSNSNTPMNNTLVKVEYPYGFTYTDSSIKPFRGDSLWKVGDLKNGDKKSLVVKGTLVGQNMEDRSFRVSAGTQSDDISKDFDAELAVKQLTVGIRKSFFDFTVTAKGTELGNGAEIGQPISINISWRNTLPDKILNSNLTAKLSGNVFDKSSVTVNDGGYYSSLDSMISWDKNTSAILGEMSPGKSGSSSFSVKAISSNTFLRAIKNPHINISIDISGTRTGLDGGTVSSSIQKTIKFNSTLGFAVKSRRNMGGLTNTGPIPPKVDAESTYTITWTISNTTNDLKDVVATSILPVGISWKDDFTPLDEKISFNPDSRVITWNAGSVPAGSGFAYSPKEVSFRVGVIPNSAQVGQVLKLTNVTNITSTDSYTGDILRSIAGEVSTAYSDPGVRSLDGVVVK